jgi:hypothetical protein
MRIVHLILYAVALTLTACATAYKPQKGFAGGYSDTQLDINVFRIAFYSNAYTSAERTEDLALLRSAEITLQNGFTHFILIDGPSTKVISTHTTPTQSATSANVTANGNKAYGTANTLTYAGQTYIISKPKSTNTIMCFKGNPVNQGLVYDAQFLCNSIGSKYKVTCKAIVSNKTAN